eukprot:1654167-Prorocentrum_lima.AAC.1
MQELRESPEKIMRVKAFLASELSLGGAQNIQLARGVTTLGEVPLKYQRQLLATASGHSVGEL